MNALKEIFKEWAFPIGVVLLLGVGLPILAMVLVKGVYCLFN